VLTPKTGSRQPNAHCGKPVAFTPFMATTYQPVTLVKCVSVKPWLVIPGDDEPGGCHDLTLGKIYECMGLEGRGSFLRIVDDSGEDYLYPLSHFREV
jgi:hypothetical protein